VQREFKEVDQEGAGSGRVFEVTLYDQARWARGQAQRVPNTGTCTVLYCTYCTYSTVA